MLCTSGDELLKGEEWQRVDTITHSIILSEHQLFILTLNQGETATLATKAAGEWKPHSIY